MRAEFAAFSRSPLRVSVAGRPFSLPWQPAAVWATSHTHVLAVRLAGQDDRDALAQLVLSEPDALTEVQAESRRILGEQTGRKWWESSRLLATSASPEILGHLTLAGVDPWSVSVGQWCAATYALCTKGGDDKSRLRFDFSLSIPPEGFDDEWDDGSDDPEQIAAAMAGWTG